MATNRQKLMRAGIGGIGWMGGGGRFAAAASLALIMAFGAGCGDDEDERALEQARLDLQALAARGGQEGGRVSYEQVGRNLAKAASSSLPGQATAAKLLQALVKARLGEQQALTAAELERRAEDRIGTIRVAFDQWLALHQTAAALASFDPGAAIQELDSQMVEADSELVKTNAERQRIAGVVADFAAKAVVARQRAKAEQDAEAEIRQRSVNATETQRAALLEQAAARKRAGDGFDKQAAYLDAEIAKERPNGEIVALRAGRLSEQRKMLEAAKAGVAQRVAVNAEQAAATRAEAGKIAKDVAARVEDLKKIRDSVVGPSDQAAALFRDAVSEATRSAGSQRGGAGLSPALYQQGLAGVLLTRARGNEAYARLLELLSGSTPALPGGPSGADAATARKAFDESYAQTKEGLAEAIRLYESGGGGGGGGAQEVQQRLDRVRSDLDKLAGGTGKVTPTAQPETPVEQPAPEPGAAATPATPEDEIRAMLGQLASDVQARGFEAVRDYILFENDQQRQMFDQMLTLVPKVEALDAACREKWGKSLMEIVAAQTGANLGAAATSLDPRDAFLKLMAPDAVNITITGESEATLAPQPEQIGRPLRASRRDGRWLLLTEDAGPGVSPELISGRMNAIGSAYERLTEKIKSGQLADEAAVFQELLAAMTQPPGGPK